MLVFIVDPWEDGFSLEERFSWLVSVEFEVLKVEIESLVFPGFDELRFSDVELFDPLGDMSESLERFSVIVLE